MHSYSPLMALCQISNFSLKEKAPYTPLVLVKYLKYGYTAFGTRGNGRSVYIYCASQLAFKARAYARGCICDGVGNGELIHNVGFARRKLIHDTVRLHNTDISGSSLNHGSEQSFIVSVLSFGVFGIFPSASVADVFYVFFGKILSRSVSEALSMADKDLKCFKSACLRTFPMPGI